MSGGQLLSGVVVVVVVVISITNESFQYICIEREHTNTRPLRPVFTAQYDAHIYLFLCHIDGYIQY